MKKNSVSDASAGKAERIKTQVSTVERVRSATGLDIPQIAEMIGIKEETVRKYAKGYQPASEAIIRLIAGIPDRLASRGAVSPGYPLTDRPLPSLPDGPQRHGDASSHQQLSFILEHAEPGEITIVRNVLDTAYSQCRKRQDAGEAKVKPSNGKHAPSDDSRRILRFPQGFKIKPLLGRIAAGLPQEAVLQTDQWVAVNPRIADDVTFVLKVSGDSMVERDIEDGDLVYLNTEKEPRNGSIVAALCDGDTCLKTYVSDKSGIFLKSENKDYPPQIIPKEAMTIQGVMVGMHPRK